jgi:hypothetical protein
MSADLYRGRLEKMIDLGARQGSCRFGQGMAWHRAHGLRPTITAFDAVGGLPVLENAQIDAGPPCRPTSAARRRYALHRCLGPPPGDLRGRSFALSLAEDRRDCFFTAREARLSRLKSGPCEAALDALLAGPRGLRTDAGLFGPASAVVALSRHFSSSAGSGLRIFTSNVGARRDI